MIISIYTEKDFDKIQQQFMIKKKNPLHKVCIEGANLNMIKAKNDKTTANILMTKS